MLPTQMLKSTLWVSDAEGRDKEALVFVNPGKPENVWYNNHLLRFYLQTPPKQIVAVRCHKINCLQVLQRQAEVNTV